MKYVICPMCGSNLDHGEICDCTKKKSEIEKESRVAVAKNNQEAKEAEIEAQRQIDLKEQEANQQVGLRKAQVAQEVGIADEKATQAVKEQAKLTKEKFNIRDLL